MSTLSTKGDKFSRTAGKLALIVSKTALSVVHSSLFLAALILEVVIIHYESLNQASILPREGQYQIAFGLAATATLAAMIGFLGIFEAIHAGKIKHDILNLYGDVFNSDKKLKSSVLDAIDNHKRTMIIGAFIAIPIAISLQIMLTMLVWKGIPYAIDYFQMEWVQDAATGEWIKTNHYDSLLQTLQGYSIGYGAIGILVAIIIGWLSPKMKDEADFVDEGWDKYVTALSLTGAKTPKTIAEFIRNGDKYDTLGNEEDDDEIPVIIKDDKKDEPPKSAPVANTSSKPAETTTVVNVSSLGLSSAKTILESKEVGIDYDTLYKSLMHYCGIDPVNLKHATSPYTNTTNDARAYITSSGRNGVAPDKVLERVSRKIMGSDIDTAVTGSEEKTNNGIKGLIWLNKKIEELKKKTESVTKTIEQKQADKKEFNDKLDNAKLSNNTLVIDSLEKKLTTLTSDIEELEQTIKINEENLSNYEKNFTSLVQDLKNVLASMNIEYVKK